MSHSEENAPGDRRTGVGPISAIICFSYVEKQDIFLASDTKHFIFLQPTLIFPEQSHQTTYSSLHPTVAIFYHNCPSLFLKVTRNVIHVTLWMQIELFPKATQKIHNHCNYWWHLINIQLPLCSSYRRTTHLFQPKTNALLIIFHHTKQPTCVHLHRCLSGRAVQASTSAGTVRAQPATASLTNAPCKCEDLLALITQLLALLAYLTRIHTHTRKKKKAKELSISNIR